jgi:hypothetical protein
MSMPKLNLKKLANDINDLSYESHNLKKHLRQNPFDSDYYALNKRLIECKRRATLLCTIRAHYAGHVHLLDQLELAARCKFTIFQMTYPDMHVNKDWLINEMFDLQETVVQVNWEDVKPYLA